MAVIPPWAMDAITDSSGAVVEGPEYDGASLRRIFSAVLGAGPSATTARPGIIDGGDVIVVDDVAYVQPCLVVVNSPDGSFVTGLDAEEPIALADRDATNPRIDRVVLQINHGPETRSASVAVLTGVPAPNPQAPATPSGAETFGTISVPADGGGGAVFNDQRRFTAGRGGVIAVPDAAALGRMDQGSPNRPAYASLGHDLYVSAGDGWQPVGVVEHYTGDDVATSTFGTISSSSTAMVVHYPGGARFVSVNVLIPSGSHPGFDPEDQPILATLSPGLRPATTTGFTLTGNEAGNGLILSNGDVSARWAPSRIGSGWTIGIAASFIGG